MSFIPHIMEGRIYMKPARYFDNIRLLVALLLIAGFQLGAGARAAWNSQEAAQAEKTKKDDKKKRDLPLETTRKVEFTTDEATWLSLDISPDGNTIVFLAKRLGTRDFRLGISSSGP